MSQAIVTASYRGDFERCRLLCESIDQRVTGHSRHLILVEPRDVEMFRALAGPRREIVDERDLLPWWLRSFPDPTSGGRRRIWLSPKGPPLRGWHVQQLRRIAIGMTIPEAVMISVDSDVVFLREFDTGAMVADGRATFYRNPGVVAGFDPKAREEHRAWSAKAGELLGIAAPRFTDTGYIATLIAWSTQSVRAMASRIETVTGRSALSALAGTRVLSECTLYGRYVDEVEGDALRHRPSAQEFCKVHWTGNALDEAGLRAFADALEPHQVAAGIQSFIGTDVSLIRKLARLA